MYLNERSGRTIVGRYHDVFAKADGAWRFTDRLVHTNLIGDLRGHLRHDLPSLASSRHA